MSADPQPRAEKPISDDEMIQFMFELVSLVEKGVECLTQSKPPDDPAKSVPWMKSVAEFEQEVKKTRDRAAKMLGVE